MALSTTHLFVFKNLYESISSYIVSSLATKILKCWLWSSDDLEIFSYWLFMLFCPIFWGKLLLFIIYSEFLTSSKEFCLTLIFYFTSTSLFASTINSNFLSLDSITSTKLIWMPWPLKGFYEEEELD